MDVTVCSRVCPAIDVRSRLNACGCGWMLPSARPSSVFTISGAAPNSGCHAHGMITASGTISILIPALIVVVLNRYLVSGLLAGSSK